LVPIVYIFLPELNFLFESLFPLLIVNLSLFFNQRKSLIALFLMTQLFFQLLLLREQHNVFLFKIIVLLLVTVTAQKHVSLINNRIISEVDEVEQNSSLLIGGIMQDGYGLMIDGFLVLK
jgi:hypothetical protein